MAGAVSIIDTTTTVTPVDNNQGGLTGPTDASAPQPVGGSAGSDPAVSNPGAGSDGGSVDDTVESVASTLAPSTLSGDGMSVDLSLGDSFQVASGGDGSGNGGGSASPSTPDTSGGGAGISRVPLITSCGCFPRIGRRKPFSFNREQ